MRFATGCVITLSTICGSMFASAQIVDQTNAWSVYSGNHRLSDRWGVHTEYQWRRNGPVKHWMQSLTRIGADRHLAGGQMITAGYAWIRSYPYGEMPVAYEFDEHRIWQQLILGQRWGRIGLQHRYRLEQRWIENKTFVEDGDGLERLHFVFRQRVRYRLQVMFPIVGSEMKDKSFFISIWDEPFIQFGRNIGLNVLDQNRLYAGIGWRIDKDRNLQLGYLNHYWIKADGQRAERNHTLQLAITWNLDLRKELDEVD